MHIGMLAPIAWRVPPRHYGPWERVVSLLTEGLVAAGVDVTLFATADSLTSAKLKAVCPRGYEEDPDIDPKVWQALHIAHAFELSGQVDLLHNHFDFVPLTYSRLVDVPIVTTVHGFSSPRIVPAYARYDDRVAYVAISNADRHPDLTYAATVYHGIDMGEFTFQPAADGPLVVLGRIHWDKGVAEAIEVARRAGRPLVIAGIVHDQAYFTTEVAPHIDDSRIRYLGPVGPVERDQLLGNAAGLLHLVNFEEPFGLSMVEAMACGTPVIATRRGSVPEIVAHGETGFVVDDLDHAVAAIDKLDQIDRSACRRRVETCFSVQRMVEGYQAVYRSLLA
jgi:glycosyltransferase involved in cell wall biosynthesis